MKLGIYEGILNTHSRKKGRMAYHIFVAFFGTGPAMVPGLHSSMEHTTKLYRKVLVCQHLQSFDCERSSQGNVLMTFCRSYNAAQVYLSFFSVWSCSILNLLKHKRWLKVPVFKKDCYLMLHVCCRPYKSKGFARQEPNGFNTPQSSLIIHVSHYLVDKWIIAENRTQQQLPSQQCP